MSVWVEIDPRSNLGRLPNCYLVRDYFNKDMIYMLELYKECVVELYSKQTRAGYDLFAIVYDADKKEFLHYQYADQGSYLPNSAFVDATTDIKTLYQMELKNRRNKYLKYIADTKKNFKGMNLKVVKGKSVPIGTKGFCIWSGLSKWGERIRVGIKDKSGNVHWVDFRNCEIDDE